MKKNSNHYLTLLIFLCSFSFSITRANEVKTTTAENKNIQGFIRIWGLVKYKSPNSIAGNFDADHEFLSRINSIKNADKSNFNRMMMEMLTNSGIDTAHVGKSLVEEEKGFDNYLLKNIDYRWISTDAFTPELTKKLDLLSRYKNKIRKHQFIPSVAYVGDLPNEKTYADYAFNKEEMNLLTLAKAWNAVEYLFPYKYKTDKSWGQTLIDMIPVFRMINSRTTYEKGILQLENALDDTHASGFLGQMKAKAEIFKLQYYPTFAYQIYDQKILIKEFLNDSIGKESELKKGDLIVEVNGIKVNQWIKQRSALLPASNQTVKNRLLSTNIDGTAYVFGDLERVFTVKVLRDKKYLNLKIEMLDRKNKNHIEMINRYFHKKMREDEMIKGYEDLEGDIGLIRAGYFSDNALPSDKESPAFFTGLNRKKALVFDMRKYPASPGLFNYYIAMALGKPAFKFARYYGADVHNPGAFFKEQGLEAYMSKDVKPQLPLYKGKIIILTNEYTQSMGEWFSMMLRQLTPHTTIIGTQTAGADGDLKYLNLPGGYQFLFTGNGIFYPDGKETQRIGILPDITYKPTPKDILSLQDAQLMEALKYLADKK